MFVFIMWPAKQCSRLHSRIVLLSPYKISYAHYQKSRPGSGRSGPGIPEPQSLLDDTFEPWDSKKLSILSKYTTSEKLSIATSFLSAPDKDKGGLFVQGHKPRSTFHDFCSYLETFIAAPLNFEDNAKQTRAILSKSMHESKLYFYHVQ